MGRIELIDDHKYILSVLNDPEMLERISEDKPKALSDSDVSKMAEAGYLLGWITDEVKGFFWVHPVTMTILQIHAHFPLGNRKDAKGSGTAMLEWLRAHTPYNYQKFIAMIPTCYPDVIGFSEREGLKKEAILTKSSLRNGKLVDIQIMGAER